MQCNEIMSRVPQFLRMEQTVLEAAQAMRDGNVGFLPICDADKMALGAVTDRDVVVRIVADGRSSDTPVRDIMSPEPLTCQESDDVTVAEELMEKHQVSRIMCVDAKGALAGIIAMADLARSDEKHVREVVQEVKSERNAPLN